MVDYAELRHWIDDVVDRPNYWGIPVPVALMLPDTSLEMQDLRPNQTFSRRKSQDAQWEETGKVKIEEKPKGWAWKMFEDAQKRRNQKKGDKQWSVRQTGNLEQGDWETTLTCNFWTCFQYASLGNDWNIYNFLHVVSLQLHEGSTSSLEHQSRTSAAPQHLQGHTNEFRGTLQKQKLWVRGLHDKQYSWGISNVPQRPLKPNKNQKHLRGYCRYILKKKKIN